MSWLSNFWSHNRDFLGNALKNAAPLSFLIPGVGPLAAAGIAGLGSAAGRGIQRGANLGNVLKQGATGAGLAYTGGALTGGQGQSLSALKNLFTGGGGTAGTAGVPGAETSIGTAAKPATGGAIRGTGGATAKDFSVAFTPSSGAPASMTGPAVAKIPASTQAFLSRGGLSTAAKSAGQFAKDYPAAAAMGLQGIGQLSTSRAQQRALDLEQERTAQRDKDLAPLYKLFMAQLQEQMGRPQTPIGPNPFWK